MIGLRFLVALTLLSLALPGRAAPPQQWIESWGTALPLLAPPPPPVMASATKESSKPSSDARPPAPNPRVPHPESFTDQTVRMVVRTSVGGRTSRLEFANIQNGSTIGFAAVHVGLAGKHGAIVPGSDRTVTFGGREGLTLYPGAHAVSDPVALELPPLTEVAVSIYLASKTPANTVDEIGLMPTYIANGNRAAATTLDNPVVAGSYFWLRGLSVPAPDANAGTIVAFGDSITEGYATTFGAHRSWPELLAARLKKDPFLKQWGVVNAGISGNRVLRTGAGESALARFTDDVLGRPGVKWVIVLESINDINFSIMPGFPRDQAANADDLIAGLGQLIERAHLHGVKVAGGTIMATKGLPFYSAEGEAMRKAVNDWIRNSGRFDAVIDFDAATRDPADPLRIRPDIDPGDHVHPNDAGNQIMADAIDLNIFRSGN